MADLSFSLDFLQQNDNLALQITDTTGTYHAVDNDDGWTSPNAEVTDIVAGSDIITASKWHLLLDVTYTGSDAVSTMYTQLSLYDLNGGAFADAGDLVFLIDAADLVSSGVAQGAATDSLLDGKYDFTYQLVLNSNHSTIEATFSESILLDGVARVKIYDQLREIPTIYDSTELFVPIYHHQFKDILVTLLKKAMFDGMLSNVSDARADEVLDTLDIIERLTVND